MPWITSFNLRRRFSPPLTSRRSWKPSLAACFNLLRRFGPPLTNHRLCCGPNRRRVSISCGDSARFLRADIVGSALDELVSISEGDSASFLPSAQANVSRRKRMFQSPKEIRPASYLQVRQFLVHYATMFQSPKEIRPASYSRCLSSSVSAIEFQSPKEIRPASYVVSSASQSQSSNGVSISEGDSASFLPLSEGFSPLEGCASRAGHLASQSSRSVPRSSRTPRSYLPAPPGAGGPPEALAGGPSPETRLEHADKKQRQQLPLAQPFVAGGAGRRRSRGSMHFSSIARRA